MEVLKPGDRIGGRFVVEALLGEGGIARVYKVRHARLGSVHAIKLLYAPQQGMQDRLLLEGRIQAQLRHPNLVSVMDIIDADDQLGLVMEFVDGINLQDHLAADGAMPIATALPLFTQVLSAVAIAHDVGVLHRDLKPANILLARGAGGLVPKVTDFGIAKVFTEGMREGTTRVGFRMGTPGYMAPEQIEDSGQVDHRVDIFALGAILYEMVAGRRAFHGDTTFATLRATIDGRYRPVTDLAHDCPIPVQDTIRKALAEEPDDRFVDCHELADVLLIGRPALRARVVRQNVHTLPDGFHQPLPLAPTPPDLETEDKPTTVARTSVPTTGERLGAPAAGAPAGPSPAVGTASPSEPAPAVAPATPATRAPPPPPDPANSRAGVVKPAGPSQPVARSQSATGGRASGAAIPLAGRPSATGPGTGVDVVIGAHADAAGRTGPQLVFGNLSPGADGPGLHGPGVAVGAAPTLADMGSGPSGGMAGARIDTLHEERDAPATGAGRFLVRLGVLFVGAMLVAGAGVWLLASRLADPPPPVVDGPAPVVDVAPPAVEAPAGQPDPAAAAPAPGAATPAATPTPTAAAAPVGSATSAKPAAGSTAAATPAATAPVAAATPSTAAASPASADEADSDEPDVNVRVGGGAEATAPVVEDAPAVPALTGSWSGSAGGRSLSLSVSSQDGERFSGRLTITTADGEHTASISGTVSPGGGRLVIREAGGEEYLFEGLVRGSGAMGTYTKGGQGGQSWSLRRD